MHPARIVTRNCTLNSAVCMAFGRERPWVDNIRNKTEEGSLIICIRCLSEMTSASSTFLISVASKAAN